MHSDPAYRRALDEMDAMFADGIGMRIAAKAAGVALSDNVNGTDLFPVLCRQAAADRVGIFLFGARDGIAKAAGERMQSEIPGLVVSGSHHGYIDGAEHEARIVEAINASGAGVLLVALGVPTQEQWMARNRGRLTVPVVIGVGGLFDYYSGRIARAPLVLRKAGLEWAWRLALEPRRLARRYLAGNAEFLVRLAYERLRTPAGFKQSPAR
jgi:exopolysaccharide biosynthesis WecB/TagA/CpsF family protein